MQGGMARPTGITILAILDALAGIWGVVIGAAAIGIASFAPGLIGGVAGTAVGVVATVFGLIWLVVGVAALALAYGFWTLQPWAWRWGIVLAVASVVVSIFSGNVLVSLVIAGIVIYYLNTPEVRRALHAPDKGWPFIGG